MQVTGAAARKAVAVAVTAGWQMCCREKPDKPVPATVRHQRAEAVGLRGALSEMSASFQVFSFVKYSGFLNIV